MRTGVKRGQRGRAFKKMFELFERPDGCEVVWGLGHYE